MENTRFLNSNPDTTIVCPSNAEGVITCAAYNHATGGLFIQSSRGYTRTGNIKPDIASPGVEVYGARSSASKFAKPGFGRESGTSISAALTAGATALFVNWGLQSDPPRYFTNREIKSLLIRGATRSSNLLYPNREWGYGTLNLYQIFQVLL
ncbi:Serine protease AprX [uncultured Ruminococcus sp.]|nr:Serine protease AprX [uncultured Ruminococcus sp.]